MARNSHPGRDVDRQREFNRLAVVFARSGHPKDLDLAADYARRADLLERNIIRA